MYRPRHFPNCKTPGVIYLLTCQCKCFYVGKTKLEFHKRAARHITSMRQADPDLPLGRHVRDHHTGKFPLVHFTILDRVHPDTRGGDWNKILLQREVCWIASLNATQFPGLNTQMSFRPFLEGFVSGGCEKEWESNTAYLKKYREYAFLEDILELSRGNGLVDHVFDNEFFAHIFWWCHLYLWNIVLTYLYTYNDLYTILSIYMFIYACILF